MPIRCGVGLGALNQCVSGASEQDAIETLPSEGKGNSWLLNLKAHVVRMQDRRERLSLSLNRGYCDATPSDLPETSSHFPQRVTARLAAASLCRLDRDRNFGVSFGFLNGKNDNHGSRNAGPGHSQYHAENQQNSKHDWPK